MQKGLIVSIQNYTLATTQELADKAIKAGAIGIRTDQNIDVKVPIIGLEKLPCKEFYITTSREAIIRVQKWADLIAIDCRIGNQDIELLLAHCHVNNIDVVADIYDLDDVKYILELCELKKINKPAFFATTFQFDKSIYTKIETIGKIKDLTNIPIIAEGGYRIKENIKAVKLYGASNICIGSAISNIEKLTKYYVNILED